MRPRFLPFTLVNVDTTDFPISFLQFWWIALDPIIARLKLLRLLGTVQLKSISSDASTKGQIKDQAHILKVVGRTVRAIACKTREESVLA